MEVFEEAHGPCHVCGKTDYEYWHVSEHRWKPGSLYWTPVPPDIWNTVRPHLAPLFSDEDHIQNVLFITPHCKPLCSAACSLAYHNGCGG